MLVYCVFVVVVVVVVVVGVLVVVLFGFLALGVPITMGNWQCTRKSCKAKSKRTKDKKKKQQLRFPALLVSSFMVGVAGLCS